MESETQRQLQTIGNYVAREESLEKNQLEKGKTDLSRNLGILLQELVMDKFNIVCSIDLYFCFCTTMVVF